MILIALILVISLILLHPEWGSYEQDYMKPETTRAVNGIFILFVFFRHIFQYRAFSDDLWSAAHWVDGHLGQFLVVSFLFFSGYGIMESIRKKGEAYVRSIPCRRVLFTWIRFALLVVLYLLLGSAVGEKYSAMDVILCLAGWQSAGNSNWYIFVILWLYLLTWIAYWAAGKPSDPKGLMRLIIIHLFLTMILAAVLAGLQQDYWYSTIFVYTAGMAFSVFRCEWNRWLSGHMLRNAGTLCVGGLLWGLCYAGRECIVVYQLAAVLFAFTLIWILGRIKIRSRVFTWLGRHLFGIYMIQRVPMILLAENPMSDGSYLLCCLLAAVCLGVLADCGTSRLAERWIRGIEG